MSGKNYLTAPDPSEKGWPKGVPYIVGNEIAERFSFYGMKSILVPYLTTLYIAAAVAEQMAGTRASADVHVFITAVYALPMIGAILADRLLGKYTTIMALSLVYCAGHGVLAFAEGSLPLMYTGLGLIAVGAGGIKSCVSANVGDQFGESNWGLTKKVYQIFYLSINFGSFFATMLIPWLLVHAGPGVAFGIPGVLMFIATVVFWLGRYRFVRVPPKPGGKLGLLDSLSGSFLFIGGLGSWLFGKELGLGWGAIALLAIAGIVIGLALFLYRQTLEPDDGFLAVLLTVLMRGKTEARRRFDDEAYDGMFAVFRVLSVIIFVSFFWTLFDQHATTWILQATRMDLNVPLGPLGTYKVLPAQTMSLNPLFVLTLIPFFIGVVFPAFEKRGIKMTLLRRMGAGMILAALSFVATAMVQNALDGGHQLSIAWQVPQYLLLTAGEVLVSATGLEFAYAQAPRRMKAVLMAFWQLTVSFGNFIAAVTIGEAKESELGSLFWWYAAAMGVVAALFIARASFYTYRDYAQK